MIRLSATDENFLASVSKLNREFDRLQRQISSGIRVQKASDDPSSVGDIVRMQADLDRFAQLHDNLGSILTEAEVADSALQRVVGIVEEAIVLGSQATSTSIGDAAIQTLAGEIRSLHAEALSLSLTTVDGRYIFGGDSDLTPPYEANDASANGVTRLTTADATRLAETAHGQRFLTSRTAAEIFDHRDEDGDFASDNVFASLAQLAEAVEAGDLDALDTSMANLRASHEYVGNHLSFYGGVQNRIGVADSQTSSLEIRRLADLSEIRATDITQAAIELSQTEAALEAALQSKSTFSLWSLFDYLR